MDSYRDTEWEDSRLSMLNRDSDVCIFRGQKICPQKMMMEETERTHEGRRTTCPTTKAHQRVRCKRMMEWIAVLGGMVSLGTMVQVHLIEDSVIEDEAFFEQGGASKVISVRN